MNAIANLDHLNAEQLRELAVRLHAEVHVKQTLIDKLTHEMAILKRHKFAATSEVYSGERQQLLFETIETDLQALSAEIEKLTTAALTGSEKRQPKRTPLPANLPRKEFHHEPDSTVCRCGCQLQRI